jgi:hypothetical protein
MFWFIPLIAGAIAIIAIAVISIKAIREWINRTKKGFNKEKIEVEIRDRLGKGDYKKVYIGIYKPKFIFWKEYSGKTVFEGKKIDDELRRRMGNKKKIIMDVNKF